MERLIKALKARQVLYNWYMAVNSTDMLCRDAFDWADYWKANSN